MHCSKCGAKMYLGSNGWECSNPICRHIEEAVLYSDQEYFSLGTSNDEHWYFCNRCQQMKLAKPLQTHCECGEPIPQGVP